MKRLLLDTNALLRFFLDDIPKQKDIVEDILKQAQKRFVVVHVAQIVIFELNFVLDKYYNFPKQEIVRSLESLVSSDYIQVESQNIFLTALNIYSLTNLSFVDCFLISKSKEEKMDLFTFDQQLQNELSKQTTTS